MAEDRPTPTDPAAAPEDLVAALAQLAVRAGANVQPGQTVVVDTDPGKEAVTLAVAAAAYDAGASYVDVVVNDRQLARIRAEHATAESLSETPSWIAERYPRLGEQRGAWIRLAGPAQPGVLDGIDPGVVAQVAPPVAPGVIEVVNARTTNWAIVPVPTPAWASIVFPDLPPGAALERLWEQVARACRLDEPDVGAAWEQRIAELERVATSLTEPRFDAIRFTGPGTDLTIGLLASSRWATGGQQTADGIAHRANLPTEETLTAPDPMRAFGTVAATKPLLVAGTLVEDLVLTFEAGRVTDVSARQGAEVVRTWIQRDEGGSRLGELALVDSSGRVGRLDTIFHETLLDENAASHIALGSAFPFCVESPEDLERINRSQIHIDVMVGSDAVAVDGVAADGAVTPLLRDGRWQHLG